VGYQLVCENIVYGGSDEKFDGIFDFVDFIQNFLSFFCSAIVFRCNKFSKTLLSFKIRLNGVKL